MTDVATEIPRSRSISIKSLVACFLILLLLTAPAVWMAPPNRRNFSVRVVFPASGWDMMANVLRLLISLVYRIKFAKLRKLARRSTADPQPFLHRIPHRDHVVRKAQSQDSAAIEGEEDKRSEDHPAQSAVAAKKPSEAKIKRCTEHQRIQGSAIEGLEPIPAVKKE